MTVFIREVDPAAVKKIDELARAQKVSRSRYLANMIQNFAALEEFKNFEERYQEIVEKCLLVIERNTGTQRKVLDIMEGHDET
jgi:hypothetical protein